MKGYWNKGWWPWHAKNNLEEIQKGKKKNKFEDAKRTEFWMHKLKKNEKYMVRLHDFRSIKTPGSSQYTDLEGPTKEQLHRNQAQICATS